MQINELNQMGVKSFREFFAHRSRRIILERKISRFICGTRVVAGKSTNPALAITGLGGWWGKEFHDDGTAINIVLRAGQFSTRFPMKFVNARSFIDHKGGLALHYQQGNPFPWMYVVDELRRIDDATVLGMTIPNVSGLRGLAFRFILQKHGGGETQRAQRAQSFFFVFKRLWTTMHSSSFRLALAALARFHHPAQARLADINPMGSIRYSQRR